MSRHSEYDFDDLEQKLMGAVDKDRDTMKRRKADAREKRKADRDAYQRRRAHADNSQRLEA